MLADEFIAVQQRRLILFIGVLVVLSIAMAVVMFGASIDRKRRWVPWILASHMFAAAVMIPWALRFYVLLWITIPFAVFSAYLTIRTFRFCDCGAMYQELPWQKGVCRKCGPTA